MPMMHTVATLFIVALALFVAVEAGNKCSNLETKYEKCLSAGYESTIIGCSADEIKSSSKKGNKECEETESKLVNKCDYSCEILDWSCAKEGYNFWGADLRSFQADDLKTCALTCAETNVCKSVTFRSSDSHCWLKNKNGGQNGPTKEEGLISMNIYCDNSPIDTSCQRQGQNFWGADILNYVSQSFDACALDCRATDACKSVTFRVSESHCWLKHRRGGQNGPSGGNDLISMNIDCDNSPLDTTCRQDNVNFWGADIMNFDKVSFEGCLLACRDTEQCVSVTFRSSDAHCWLKNKRDGANGATAEEGLISMNIDC